jgi:Ice-binding-like/Bacterial Ig-like domain
MSGHMHGVAAPTRRSEGVGRGWTRAACFLALVGALLSAGLGLLVPSALAASTTTVNLGTASTYAALSGASVANTVSAPSAPFTTLRGDLGVVANTAPSGFPPGVVTGTINFGNGAATQAGTDAQAAYAAIAARTGGVTKPLALAGLTIMPGLYTISGAASNTTTLTLDGGGNPNAVFVFQVGGALAFAAGSQVVLTNGAQASNVFWQVNGAAAIGANATFAGTLIASAAVAVGNASLVNGRAFALNGALTLDDNEFYSAPPTVTIAGGSTADVNTSSPTISGTTDLVAPKVVTVTIDGQTLTATPSAGSWSVPAPTLANGTYPVTASATDGAGNVGTATQQLTIDTVPPVLTLGGGATVTTNNSTPTISGATDVTPGTVVHVTVGSQNLGALVQSSGTWNVATAALIDGTYTATASVTDPAGNQTAASQAVTVDTTAPAVTIAGGAKKLTDDPTPTISGTAAVAPGTPVTVSLADQTLTGLVQLDGSWSMTAAHLADGPHRIVMSVSDEAGNAAGRTQILTVDTVAPDITITGGATAATANLDPTITGTSDAAPGTTVTVSLVGQTMTTLVQTTGNWNTTPTTAGRDGTWPVVASVTDPAGNVGSAKQRLTIATGAVTVSLPPGSPGSTGSPGSSGNSGGSGAAGRPSPASQLIVTVDCAAAYAGDQCRGTLMATSRVTTRAGTPEKVTADLVRADAGARHPKQKQKTTVVEVASGSYSVAAGQKAKITLALNKQGKQLLDRFYRVPATLKMIGAISATRAISFSYVRVHAGISAEWTPGKSSTSLKSLTISRLPAASTVTVACHGGGCSFAKRTFSAKAKSLTLSAKLGNPELKPGATLEVTVGVSGQVGEVARFAVRSGRAPAQASLCLVPQATTPSACAAA